MNGNTAKRVWGGKFPFRRVNAEEPVEQPRVSGFKVSSGPAIPAGKQEKWGWGGGGGGAGRTTGQENSVLDRKADYLMALPSPSSQGTSGGWRSKIFPMEGPAAPLNRSHSSPRSEQRRRQIMRSGCSRTITLSKA